MAKTYRRDDIEGKDLRDGERNSHRYSKENKFVRVRNARDIRHQTNRKLREVEDSEDIEDEVLPEYQHTSGWDSW